MVFKINSDGTPDTIYVRPVFAVLNQETLSMFENEHLSSLYSAINLQEVTGVNQPPKYNVSGIFCADVMRGDKAAAVGKTQGQTPPPDVRAAQICFTNVEEMMSWKNAIETFNEIIQILVLQNRSR